MLFFITEFIVIKLIFNSISFDGNDKEIIIFLDNINNLEVEDNRSLYDKSGSSYIISKEDNLEKPDLSKNDTLSSLDNINNLEVEDNLEKSDLPKNDTLSSLDNINFSALSIEEKQNYRLEKALSDPVYKKEAIETFYKQKQEISELDTKSKDFKTKKEEIIKKYTDYIDNKYC